MNNNPLSLIFAKNAEKLGCLRFSSYFPVLTAFIFVTSLAVPPSVIAEESIVKPSVKKKQSVVRKKRFLNRRTKKKGTATKNRKAPKRTATRTPSRLARANRQKQGRAVVESVRNKVSVRSSNTADWKQAKKNATVDAASQVKTGRRSLARLKLEDGSKILILQNSQAELDSLSSLQKTIKLLRGRIRAVVRKLKAARTFKIQTPIGVASVRGTEFEVEYFEDDQEMLVDVIKGQVGVSKLGDLAEEVILNPGDRLRFGIEGAIGNPIQTGAIPLNRQDVRTEVQIASVKNSIMSQAAEESRNADYQVGKSLIDVDGTRVRVEEYITRPASNQFKLVALNERATRFDYFTYLGTFNQNLPTDLSVALSQVGGKLGTTAPDYYLTAYETVTSNTVDSITDSGSGGHLVQIDFDGTNYTLTDNDDGSNTRTIAASTLQGDGSYKIYNPIKDTFSLVTAANLTDALKISILDSGNYRNLISGDQYWKTRFNTSSFSINSTVKTSWAQATTANTLALDLDATFTNSPITTISEFPSGSGSLHNRLSLFYADGTKVVYDNYIIDDEGTIAESSRFSGISTSEAYQNELLNWNYQQKVTANEMDGRSINLVIDPRIGTMSGLIQ